MTARTPDILSQGARLVRDFVTPAEERRILQRIAAAPWLRDLNRRVQHYGYRYSYRNPGAREAASPFPLWAEPVHRERVPSGPGHRHARRSPRLRRKCGGQTYVAVTSVHGATCRTNQNHRNITALSHNEFRKAITPLSFFHGRLGPGSAASQSASALAFISKSISA